MFAFLDSPAEIGILVLVILLLFGGSQLPKLAKNLGQAQKEFKDGLNVGQKGEEKDVKSTTTTTVVSTPTVSVSEAEKAAELRKLEERMAELKGEQPRSTEL
jgi:sec-independent protein translocase protein TatA